MARFLWDLLFPGLANEGDEEAIPNHMRIRPIRRDGRRGAYTGLTRPKYPRVFRPYGINQRERLIGRRPTGMHTTGYAKEIVESRPVPPFLPTHAALGQSGTSAVTSHIPALQPGSGHWLFDAS